MVKKLQKSKQQLGESSNTMIGDMLKLPFFLCSLFVLLYSCTPTPPPPTEVKPTAVALPTQKISLDKYKVRLSINDSPPIYTRELYKWIKDMPEFIKKGIDERTYHLLIIIQDPNGLLTSKKRDSYEKMLREYKEITNMIIGDINGFPIPLITTDVQYCEDTSSHLMLSVRENCLSNYNYLDKAR